MISNRSGPGHLQCPGMFVAAHGRRRKASDGLKEPKRIVTTAIEEAPA